MSGKNYVYAGYVEGRSLPEVTRAQAKKLTHLNIAFGVVQDNKITVDYMRHYLSYLPFIREFNPNLQILISTGGGGAGGHPQATTPENLPAFVDSTMDVLREFGLDGIDCDWEFPRDATQRQQHIDLMFAYRRALDDYERERGGKKAWLTAAVDIGPTVDETFLANVDVKKILEVVDFYNIMTYDFHCLEQRAGHHSAVYESKNEPIPSGCLRGIRRYNEAGVPNDKMVVGAAFYPKQWNAVPDGGTHGLHQECGEHTYGPAGRYDAIRAAFELNPDYIKYWDADAQACWLYNGYQFITYEDPRAIKAKCDFARENGLKGVMYWVHRGDGDGTLFNAIYDGLFL